MKTIKCGVMPGRLQELAIEEGTTAREVIELAGLTYSNHEIRLDGNKIDIDTDVSNGSLCVLMKAIKGNAMMYVSEYNKDEIAIFLEANLPTELSTEDVVDLGGNCTMIFEDIVVDTQMFLSVYKLTEGVFDVEETIEAISEIIAPIEAEHVCTCDKNAGARNIITNKICDIEEERQRWLRYVEEETQKIAVLKEILKQL